LKQYGSDACSSRTATGDRRSRAKRERRGVEESEERMRWAGCRPEWAAASGFSYVGGRGLVEKETSEEARGEAETEMTSVAVRTLKSRL
jgi:hypothetical protein